MIGTAAVSLIETVLTIRLKKTMLTSANRSYNVIGIAAVSLIVEILTVRFKTMLTSAN